MSATEHPVAGTIFLMVMAGALGFGAYSGIKGSRAAAIRHEINEAVDLARAEKYGRAEELLRGVLRRDPQNSVALFNLALVQYGMECPAGTEKCYPDRANETFARLLDLRPDDYDAMMYRARILKQKSQVDEALSMLERIPAGKGHVAQMLEQDAVWEDLDGAERMNNLRKKHGLEPLQPPPKKEDLRNETAAGYQGPTPTEGQVTGAAATGGASPPPGVLPSDGAAVKPADGAPAEVTPPPAHPAPPAKTRPKALRKARRPKHG